MNTVNKGQFVERPNNSIQLTRRKRPAVDQHVGLNAMNEAGFYEEYT